MSHLLPFCLCLSLMTSAAQGESAPAAPAPATLPPITVIATTPVPGLTLDIDKIPGSVQVLSASELRQNGAASLVDALDTRIGSISINAALADPFQPDILFRGFEASPVLGVPQGMAVYQNGVRVNEAFGDTVNWDLIPDIAIERISILSATSLYGLNALGGAMSVTMKNGFTHSGASAALSGGSFDQHQAEAEYGAHRGILGIYAALRVLNQAGWRVFAHDAVHQYYLDLSLHEDPLDLDLSYSRVDNQLAGQGAAPVQSLALDRRAVFTGPQKNLDKVDFATLNATYQLSRALALQSVLYFKHYRQAVENGDSSDYTACTDAADAGLLCQGDGSTPLLDSSRSPIPDITHDGSILIGQNDFETIHSQSVGASLQFTSNAKLAGLGNAFALGVTLDASLTQFFSGTELGVLDPALTVLPSNYRIYTPEGTDFSATPVSLSANNKYYGGYLTETLDLLPELSLTVAGRYNIAKVDLSDRIGTALNGNNRFTHFNPSIGAAYKWAPGTTVFGGYSINNRTPTASEIECSDPHAPCLLPSSLASDPPNLRQVVARTGEIGARGHAERADGGKLDWNLSLYRTHLENDIYGIATSVSSGYFQNIGATRRQGLEAGVNYQSERASAYGQYSLVDATFRSPLTLHSPANPFQDSEGDIHVASGSRLPLIPKHRLKIGADATLLPRWSVGGSLSFVGSQFYRGDESNQNPQLNAFTVISLRSSYRVTPRCQLFANVQNLFDRRYANFALFGDPAGVGARGVPAAADVPLDPGVDPRFESPAMPRAFFGGIRWSF